MRFVALAVCIGVSTIGCLGKITPSQGGGAGGGGAQSGGAAGGGQGGGATTAGGDPTAIAWIDDEVESLAVDDAFLYMGSMSGILRMPKEGGAVQKLADASGFNQSIVVDDRYVYWTNLAVDTIERAAKDGAPGGEPPRAWTSGDHRPGGLVLADGQLYWANEGSVEAGGKGHDGEIVTMPSAGGDRRVLASGLDAPRSLVVRGGYVYFTSSPYGGQLGRVAIDGGAVEMFVRGGSGSMAMCAMDRDLVVGNREAHALTTISLSGSPGRLLTTGTVDPESLFCDRDAAYSGVLDAEMKHARLVRVGADGSVADVAAWTMRDRLGWVVAAIAFAGDANRIYFADSDATREGMKSVIHAVAR